MPEVKISALPAAGALDGTETFPVVQGGVTKRTTGLAPASHLTDAAAHSGTFVRVNEGPLSLKDSRVNATLDGAADDTAALNAAKALLPATGGSIYHPGGVLKTTAAVAIDRAIHLAGEGLGRSIIRNAVSDIFNISGNNFSMSKMAVEARSGGGHIFNQVEDVGGPIIRDCYLLVDIAGTKSIWKNNGFVLVDGLFEGGRMDTHPLTTVPAWNLVASGASINRNTWMNLRCTHSGEYFIHVENTGASWNLDNAFRDINFEIPTAGCIKLLGHRGGVIDNCSAYDLTGPTTRDLFYIGKSAVGGSLTSRDIELRGLHRWAGSLGAGLKDLKLVDNPTGVTVVCPSASGGTPFTIDFGGAAATSVGIPTDAVVTNRGAEFVGIGAHTVRFGTSMTLDADSGSNAIRSSHALKTLSGTTAQRPGPATINPGGMYFDTTLNKPIWTNGAVWKDATGANV